MSTLPSLKLAVFTILALVAFAANSVLCKMALASGAIAPAPFTIIRLLSGALTLAGLLMMKRGGLRLAWAAATFPSALALGGYAVFFSYAYVALDTGTGALILFACVQITMFGGALLSGQKLALVQWVGAAAAMTGLISFLIPAQSIKTPDVIGATFMALSGVAWGVYSLRGRRGKSALQTTAGNFIMASLMFIPALFIFGSVSSSRFDGVVLAVLSGAVTSGLGYAVWYAALSSLKPQTAAISQLSVPLIAAGGGILMLGESLTPRFIVACVLVLGGIFCVIRGSRA